MKCNRRTEPFHVYQLSCPELAPTAKWSGKRASQVDRGRQSVKHQFMVSHLHDGRVPSGFLLGATHQTGCPRNGCLPINKMRPDAKREITEANFSRTVRYLPRVRCVCGRLGDGQTEFCLPLHMAAPSRTA
jgi:hypothetical protein